MSLFTPVTVYFKGEIENHRKSEAAFTSGSNHTDAEHDSQLNIETTKNSPELCGDSNPSPQTRAAYSSKQNYYHKQSKIKLEAMNSDLKADL
jgi:hypothetical protein